ncbi:hypothetical protein BDZ97DRAFT_1329702 [Flammula alnicola]|nr:hypothetical protein BDZ97DRAFT_1329702 [Flammula alnicola]
MIKRTQAASHLTDIESAGGLLVTRSVEARNPTSVKIDGQEIHHTDSPIHHGSAYATSGTASQARIAVNSNSHLSPRQDGLRHLKSHNIIPLPDVSSLPPSARELGMLDGGLLYEGMCSGMECENCPLSPLWLDETAAGEVATYPVYFDTDGVDEPLFSDPEEYDYDSETDSELSFAMAGSPGRYTPFSEIDDELLLAGSLLFRVDPEPLSLDQKDSVPTLQDVFFEKIPDELRDMLVNMILNYDAYLRTLAIVIGGNGEVNNKQETDNDCPWYNYSHISSLSVSIAESSSTTRDDEETMAKQYQSLLWILDWAQATYGHTIEAVDISLPKSFTLPDTANDLLCGPVIDSITPTTSGAVPNLHTLTWSGNLRFLPRLLPVVVSHNMKVLKINSELSIDDALSLLRHFSNSEIQELELGCLARCAPSLPGSASDGRGASSPGYLALPVDLPHLDSLKIATAIPLDAFFATLYVPNLCKLEVDLTAAISASEEVLHSLLASALLGQRLLFVDVQHNGPCENGEKMKGLVKQRAPFAYVSVNGEGHSGNGR